MADRADTASPDVLATSFCPLRWSYLQVDLQHARVRACCKTPSQTLTSDSLRELGADAIFDGHHVRERRAEMLRGIHHSDCAACWSAERLGIQSYRQLQVTKPIFSQVGDLIQIERERTAAVPRHVEVILRTTCDLACSYCSADFSSRWQKEIEQRGPYPADGGLTVAPAGRSPDEFETVFQAWLERELPSLRYLQFNGGEPLIQDVFYQFVDQVLAHPGTEQLQLGVITNLNTPPARLRQLLAVLPLLHRRHNFRFGVSLDAVGSRAEYIRYGLRWQRFDANIRALLTAVPDLDVQFAPTMSALNVSSTPELIRYVRGLEVEFDRPLVFRPSMVMWPDFQSPLILRPDDYVFIDQAIALLTDLRAWPELRSRLVEIREAAARAGDAQLLRAAFYRWFTEYDHRRGLSFEAVFPELQRFWATCAEAASASQAASRQPTS